SAAASCEAAIRVMAEEPQRQQRLRASARKARAAMGLPQNDCPIIPVIFGDESAAMKAAEDLKEKGMLVLPVRPPTVPRGPADCASRSPAITVTRRLTP